MIKRIPVNDCWIFRKTAPDPEPVLRTHMEAAVAKTPNSVLYMYTDRWKHLTVPFTNIRF